MEQLSVYQSIIDNYLEVQKIAIKEMGKKSVIEWSRLLNIARGTVYKKIECESFTASELTTILKNI